MKEHLVTMPDGRTVGVADYGARGQTAVIWCHGGPGCRLEPGHFGPAATRLGSRLIGIDRPGYGQSGTSDTLAPAALATYTQRIVPGASLDVREGLGHFSILPEIVPVLGKLLGR